MKKNHQSKYAQRGVSTQKEDVHAAVAGRNKGLFPNAFCTVLPDILGGDQNKCYVQHADGAGTKSSLAYLYWRETGDLSVFKGIAQDAAIMNIDDLICVGAINNIALSSTIGRNKHLIPGEVVKAVIDGFEEVAQMLTRMGIPVFITGGETADVADLVRTIIVDATASVTLPRKDVIEVNIQPGDVIVGLSSFGMATYEQSYNAGMGSNGLTSARHDVFKHKYASDYPETYDPGTSIDLIYQGSYALTDEAPDMALDVGKAVLSPTRTYAPVLKHVFETIGRENINGIIHCSGGAQTKVMKFVKNMHVIKDNLFPTPPLFAMIQHESGTEWSEMYEVFNMGHRMELYLPNEDIAYDVISIAQRLGVFAGIIGRCEGFEGKKLTIESAHGTFTY